MKTLEGIAIEYYVLIKRKNAEIREIDMINLKSIIIENNLYNLVKVGEKVRINVVGNSNVSYVEISRQSGKLVLEAYGFKDNMSTLTYNLRTKRYSGYYQYVYF